MLLTLHPPLLLPCFPRRALCPLGPLASSYLLPVCPFDDDLDLEGPFLPEHDGVSLQALTGVPLLLPSPFPTYSHRHAQPQTHTCSLTDVPSSPLGLCTQTCKQTCAYTGLFPSYSLTWGRRPLDTRVDCKKQGYPERSRPSAECACWLCLQSAQPLHASVGQLLALCPTPSDYSLPPGWPTQLPWPLLRG